MNSVVILWVVPGLYLLCLGGLTYFILQSFQLAAVGSGIFFQQRYQRGCISVQQPVAPLFDAP